MIPSPRALKFWVLGGLGRNARWRYVLSSALFLAIGTGLSVVLMLFLQFGLYETHPELAEDVYELFLGGVANTAPSLLALSIFFTLLMLAVIGYLVAARLVFPAVHGRAWLTFVTHHPRFDYGAFWRSGWILLVLLVSASVYELYLDPSAYRFVFEPASFFAFLPLVLLLTPLQVLAEEVVFRGYLLQAVSAFARSFLARLAVPAVLFAAIHIGNPEIENFGALVLIDYLLVGLYLGVLTLRSHGIEQAVGFHLANNVFAFSLVSYDGGELPIPSVYVDPSMDYTWTSPFALAALMAVHFVLLTAWSKLARKKRK